MLNKFECFVHGDLKVREPDPDWDIIPEQLGKPYGEIPLPKDVPDLDTFLQRQKDWSKRDHQLCKRMGQLSDRYERLMSEQTKLQTNYRQTRSKTSLVQCRQKRAELIQFEVVFHPLVLKMDDLDYEKSKLDEWREHLWNWAIDQNRRLHMHTEIETTRALRPDELKAARAKHMPGLLARMESGEHLRSWRDEPMRLSHQDLEEYRRRARQNRLRHAEEQARREEDEQRYRWQQATRLYPMIENMAKPRVKPQRRSRGRKYSWWIEKKPADAVYTCPRRVSAAAQTATGTAETATSAPTVEAHAINTSIRANIIAIGKSSPANPKLELESPKISKWTTASLSKPVDSNGNTSATDSLISKISAFKFKPLDSVSSG